MVREFKLPDIGEGVHEGEIVKWLVKEGQPIQENDLMVEVMTDKVTVQIPSPMTGKVLKLNAKEGEVVNVGTTIIVLGEEGEEAPGEIPAKAEAEPVSRAPTAPEPAPTAAPGGPVLATPAVRKLARELGVALDRVRGTGPRGRLTEENVRAAAAAPAVTVEEVPAVREEAKPDAPEVKPAAGEERIPIHGLRRRIAEKMAKSTSTAARFTYVEEVDMTQLVHLRDRLKATAEDRGVRLTYLPFIVRALVAALRVHPTLNATVDDEKQELVVKRVYNIGIATATDEGLTVTVVHDSGKRDIWQLAAEVERLAAAAREKRLTLPDIQGSTFTITSLGREGGILATPIINWPEVGIIGIHKIEKRPVVRNDQIVIRDMMYLSCSFDHRVIDGHVGAAFVQTLREHLEHPALLFVE